MKIIDNILFNRDNFLGRIFIKYKSIILYVFFGGLTTGINIGSYCLLYYALGISNSISNVVSWVLSVIFAFITNKKWVFESRSYETKVLMKETLSFFSCRLATGIMDFIIMYVVVDCFHLLAWLFKIISNVLVIVLNYVASKLFVFKNKTDKNK